MGDSDGSFYSIPSIVAFRRRHPNRWIIFAINVAFGATVIGWIGCLVWAFHAAHLNDLEKGSHGGESGLNIFANDIKRVSIEQPVSNAPSSSRAQANDIDELRRLADLHSRGLLTMDEFVQLKTRVLSRV